MNRLIASMFVLVSGCAVVTSYPYKPISTDGVVKSERCSTHYSYRTQIDDGIELTVNTADANYTDMFVNIDVSITGANTLRLLENSVRIESADDGSVQYGEVQFFSAVVSIRNRPIEKRQAALLTGTGNTDDEKQIASVLGHMPFVANVKFGKFFPRRFTLYLPAMQTSWKTVTVPPLSFEMQEEKSVSGVLCGL